MVILLMHLMMTICKGAGHFDKTLRHHKIGAEVSGHFGSRPEMFGPGMDMGWVGSSSVKYDSLPNSNVKY